ncbi:hypothetical protein PMAYCL1PPCAC_19240, partial [Pristionchus mayeri]
QSHHRCQKFDNASQCVNGCCNSTQFSPSSNSCNPSQHNVYNTNHNTNQNTNGMARENSINEITYPFNDPSASACADGRCPSGENNDDFSMSSASSLARRQDDTETGCWSSSALQCELASGMCCACMAWHVLWHGASDPGASGYAQLQYPLGLSSNSSNRLSSRSSLTVTSSSPISSNRSRN